MTSSNPAYKRRRIDLAAPQQLPAAAAAPRTPPALTAFHVGAAAAAGQVQPPGALLDLPITGTVEAQFDAGYFVSIVAGSQEFRGESSIPSMMTHQPPFSIKWNYRYLPTCNCSKHGVNPLLYPDIAEFFRQSVLPLHC